MTRSIRTCLWFNDGRGREAAEFYCSLISGSRVERTFSSDVGHGAFSVIDFSLGVCPTRYSMPGQCSLSPRLFPYPSKRTLKQSQTAMVCSDSKRRRGKSLRLVERSVWCVLAGIPRRLTELTMNADKKFLQRRLR